MPKQKFSDFMHECELMSSGIEGNKDELASVGIDAKKAKDFDTLYSTTKKLNNEQEKLKADLKSKTDELNTKNSELKDLYSEMKKRIKVQISQPRWKEFGIQDKR